MASAMTSIMTTGSAVIAKAGSGVSAAFDDFYTEQGLLAEAVVNATTRVDWTSLYPTLGSSTRFILSDTVASLVANTAIAFDMTGYPSRIVAEDMINVNRDTVLRNLGVLRDQKVKVFVSGGTFTV